MAIFRLSICTNKNCTYRHHVPKPIAGETCTKCGQEMRCLPNYYISYQIDGRKYVEAVGPQKRLAEDALGKRRSQIREGRFFDRKQAVSWSEAVEKLRRTFAFISRATVAMYENSLKILEAHGLSRQPFSNMDIDGINDYIADRQQEGVTNSTINRELATIKRMARLSKLWDCYNELELLPENDPRTMVLTEEQQQALLRECQSPQLRLAVLIALETGLRKEGVYGLKWADIDFPSRTISRVVKGNKRVYIPLTSRLEGELKAWRQQAHLSQYVFPSPRRPGEPLRKDGHTAFKNACARAGLNGFRYHDLRHTFATHFLAATKDLAALQEILGHSDIKLTRRYAHVLDDHKRSAMRLFEERSK